MLPVYDPKSFASVDLRKYHIRTVKDAIKFLEFTMSRMEEALFIMKKFNTQYATYQNVATQLQKRVQEEATTYGAGAHQNMAEKEGEIQSVEEPEDNTVAEERQALLDELRQSIADESVQPVEGEELGQRLQAEYEKYKVVVNKKTGRHMYYRQNENGKTSMVSDKDVPNDIKELLSNKLAEEEE